MGNKCKNEGDLVNRNIMRESFQAVECDHGSLGSPT